MTKYTNSAFKYLCYLMQKVFPSYQINSKYFSSSYVSLLKLYGYTQDIFLNYLLLNDFSVCLRALLEFYSQISLHGTMFIFKMHLSLFKKFDSFLKR